MTRKFYIPLKSLEFVVDVELRKAYFGKRFALNGFIVSRALGLHEWESEIIAFRPVVWGDFIQILDDTWLNTTRR